MIAAETAAVSDSPPRSAEFRQQQAEIEDRKEHVQPESRGIRRDRSPGYAQRRAAHPADVLQRRRPDQRRDVEVTLIAMGDGERRVREQRTGGRIARLTAAQGRRDPESHRQIAGVGQQAGDRRQPDASAAGDHTQRRELGCARPDQRRHHQRRDRPEDLSRQQAEGQADGRGRQQQGRGAAQARRPTAGHVAAFRLAATFLPSLTGDRSFYTLAWWHVCLRLAGLDHPAGRRPPGHRSDQHDQLARSARSGRRTTC